MKTHETDVPAVPAGDCRTMTDVRREIDRIDSSLVRLLSERLTYIERAGHIKAERQAVRDEDRIQDVLSKVRASCLREGFPYAIAEPVWRQLMEGCIAHEFDIYDARMADAQRVAAAAGD